MEGGVIVGVVVGVVAYAAFLTAVIVLATRWSRKLLQAKSDALLRGLPLAKQIGERQKPKLYRGAETEYEIDGRRVVLNTYYQNRSWVRASLRIDGGPYPSLTVFPEGGLERFGKAIGLNREVQTGDQAFDELAYLDTWDSDENVRRVTDSAAVRGAMSELLMLGFKVQLWQKGVEAFQLVRAREPLDGTKAGPAVQALGRLADALPSFSGLQLAPARTPGQVAFGLMLVLSWLAGMLLAGALERSIARTLVAGTVALVFILGGGLVWALYVAVLVAMVRGRSYAMRTVLIGGVLAVLGVPVGGGALLLWLNQSLDSSAVVAHPLTVLEHRKLKKGNGCRLTVQGFQGEPTQQLRVWHSGGDEELAVGSPVTVRSHRGAFGWEWIEPVTADAR